MATIIQKNLIKDDQGEYWTYSDNRIRCVGDDSEDGGYECDSFEAGVRLLAEYGYIDIIPE
jgi:hypothetical protein